MPPSLVPEMEQQVTVIIIPVHLDWSPVHSPVVGSSALSLHTIITSEPSASSYFGRQENVATEPKLNLSVTVIIPLNGDFSLGQVIAVNVFAHKLRHTLFDNFYIIIYILYNNNILI